MLGLEVSQAEKDTALSNAFPANEAWQRRSPNSLSALSASPAMAYVLLLDSTLSTFVAVAAWEYPKEPDCLRHHNDCPVLFDHLNSLWPGTGECISPTAILHDLSQIAVRSDRLCILLSGLVDAFVTAFNVWSSNRASHLNLKELMYGSIKMMTAQWSAWAHTYQSTCFNVSADQLRPAAFRQPKPKKWFSMLPTCRTTIISAKIITVLTRCRPFVLN